MIFLSSRENQIRNKWFGSLKLENALRNNNNSLFWVLNSLIWSENELRQHENRFSPRSYLIKSVSSNHAKYFVIIHKPWLKKIFTETGKVAEKEDFLLLTAIFWEQFISWRWGYWLRKVPSWWASFFFYFIIN